MQVKLKDRMDDCISRSAFRMLPKLPIAIVVNGRGFRNATALIDKPFSDKLAKALCAAMMALVQEIGGAVFGYQFDDEIVIISRNDQNIDTQPWCGNETQKIASIAASVATLSFNSLALINEIDNFTNATFTGATFAVPNLTEAINLLVSKQQQAFQSSIHNACFYELLKRNKNAGDIEDLLANTSNEDKKTLLEQECGIDYNTAYPIVFRRGAACYRRKKTVEYQGVENSKMAWAFDTELPIFTKDTAFLGDIFGTTTTQG